MEITLQPYKTMLLALALGLGLLTSCYQATIEVHDIPENTPAGDPIYISGNFNNWDPGDESYRLTLLDDSIYQVRLPMGFGRIEYKFTRGDWSTVEKDLCGYEINNRHFYYGEDDVIIDSILSWNDKAPVNCPQVTIILNDIPENTPGDALLSIAGDFNNWDPGDRDFTFSLDSATNQPVLTIPRMSARSIRFIITRGSLLTKEADELGFEMPPRSLDFGEEDTVYLSVDNWEDLGMGKGNYITYIIDKVPPNTPPGDQIYFMGEINSWYPRDRNLVLQKGADGRYFIRFPKKKQGETFKFSRGDWNTVEVDAFGYDIGNRFAYFGEEDTVYLQIENWKDLSEEADNEILVRLVKLPANTPPGDNIYLAANINGWDPGSLRWKLEKHDDNTYSIHIPRGGGVMEFKFTRGSWKTVESRNGIDIDNRILRYADITTDVIDLEVADWIDLPPRVYDSLTIIIEKMPLNTPKDDDIYLAPDFNGWNPGDPSLIFKKNKEGLYEIRAPFRNTEIYFKVTRGNWSTVEVDAWGDDIENRHVRAGYTDVLRIQVKRWKDLY